MAISANLTTRQTKDIRVPRALAEREGRAAAQRAPGSSTDHGSRMVKACRNGSARRRQCQWPVGTYHCRRSAITTSLTKGPALGAPTTSAAHRKIESTSTNTAGAEAIRHSPAEPYVMAQYAAATATGRRPAGPLVQNAIPTRP